MSKGTRFLRFLPTLIWIAVVGGGVVFLVATQSSGPAAPDLVAATSLPQNALLSGDVAHPKLTGRYIVKPEGIRAGEIIKAGHLGINPVPPSAPPPLLLLVFPLSGPAAAESLAVGSRPHVCDASSNSLAEVTVQYVHCKNGAVGCSATLHVPFDAAAGLANGLQDPGTAQSLRLAHSCKP
jgi:hypothetical protein